MARSAVSAARTHRLSRPHDHEFRPRGCETAARASLVLDAFREVVVVDTEFITTPGDRPIPVCLVAHEMRSGHRFRIWRDHLGPSPPYAMGPDVLFVAYYASAELGCYRVLSWPTPERILDLFTEFRARTNGVEALAGNSLLGALSYFGLDGMGAAEKEDMRALIMRGGPWTEDERTAILNYCEADVDALERLLPAMLPQIDLPRALLRGRYMAAAAAMEHAGTPIDGEMLELFQRHWTSIQDRLIAEIDAAYGVFDGRIFKAERFAGWLAANNIPWPLRESGHLDLSDDTFRQQARAHPMVSPLRELRSSLCRPASQRSCGGTDARNRTILSAFRSRTGRNQPSNTQVYIWAQRVAARLDQTAAGPCGRLRRLVPARDSALPPPCPATRRLQAAYRVGRLLSRLRQTGRRRAAGRHQSDARRRSASFSNNACWRSSTAWNGRPWRCGSPNPVSSPAICCALTARLTAGSGNGRTPLVDQAMLIRRDPHRLWLAGACR